jgi:hypothetical protein
MDSDPCCFDEAKAKLYFDEWMTAVIDEEMTACIELRAIELVRFTDSAKKMSIITLHVLEARDVAVADSNGIHVCSELRLKSRRFQRSVLHYKSWHPEEENQDRQEDAQSQVARVFLAVRFARA